MRLKMDGSFVTPKAEGMPKEVSVFSAWWGELLGGEVTLFHRTFFSQLFFFLGDS